MSKKIQPPKKAQTNLWRKHASALVSCKAKTIKELVKKLNPPKGKNPLIKGISKKEAVSMLLDICIQTIPVAQQYKNQLLNHFSKIPEKLTFINFLSSLEDYAKYDVSKKTSPESLIEAIERSKRIKDPLLAKRPLTEFPHTTPLFRKTIIDEIGAVIKLSENEIFTLKEKYNALDRLLQTKNANIKRATGITNEKLNKIRAIVDWTKFDSVTLSLANALIDKKIEPIDLIKGNPESIKNTIKNLVPQKDLGNIDIVINGVRKKMSEEAYFNDVIKYLELPKKAINYLEKNNICNNHDLLKKGGTSKLIEVGKIKNKTLIRKINAYTYLNILSNDIAINTKLINKDYVVPFNIVKIPKHKFIAELKPDIGEIQAQKIYDTSLKQTAYLNNMAAAIAADSENNYQNGLKNNFNIPLPKQCECKDSESAVSPIAYLADLLRYTLDHVSDYYENTDENSEITLDRLKFYLHQDFDKLPTTGELIEKEVKQARIVIEVLRRRINIITLTDEKQKLLEEAEIEYCLSVYRNLLLRIGTNLEEIRLSRTVNEEKKQDIADKLALDSVNRLNELRIQPEDMSEQLIQTIFGLNDTNPDRQDPLESISDPKLLQWRLEFLKNIWWKEDWPEDELPENLPIIDPDVIGPDDFRNATIGNPCFNLWLYRRKWIDKSLKTIDKYKIIRNIGKVPDIEKAINLMLNNITYSNTSIVPWNRINVVDDLIKIYNKLLHHDEIEVEKAEKKISFDLALQKDSFCRLAELIQKHQKSILNVQNEKLTNEEWYELRSILVQAWKTRFFTFWKKEENNLNIELTPDTFHISATEPKEGIWPPLHLGKSPLIDPEKININDLPDYRTGKQAKEIWNKRYEELKNIAVDLTAVLPDYEQALLNAIGNKDNRRILKLPHDLEELKNKLTSSDPTTVENAETDIQEDLYMSVEDFTRMMVIISKYKNNNPEKQPTQADQKEFVIILTSAQKSKRNYPTWLSEENDRNSGISYWFALKASIPAWRASLEQRISWQYILRQKQRNPIIDPDIIGLGDIKNLINSDPAYKIWNLRKQELDEKLDSIKTKRESEGLDAALKAFTNTSADELLDWKIMEELGFNIDPYLKQIFISRNAFLYLLSFINLDKNNEIILDAEWDEVCSIILQNWKESNFYKWHIEELDETLLLSPQYFIDERSIERDLPKWRFSQDLLWEWQDKLDARIKQEQSVREALQKIISDTEELTLPAFRDSLIEVLAVTSSIDEMADILSNRFLIDMKMSGCQTTTHVSQAITTIQGLLHSLRMDLWKSYYPYIELNAPSFDEDWKWMGSYATWRAAMFVFLYPENLLYPSLQPNPSGEFKSIQSLISPDTYISTEFIKEVVLNTQLFTHHISNLEIKVIVECDEPNYLLLFGQSNNKTFWSIHETIDASDFSLSDTYLRSAQLSFWVEIPSISEELVGATSMGNYIFLIVKVCPYEGSSFRNIKYTRCKKSDIQIDNEKKVPLGSWEDFNSIANSDYADIIFRNNVIYWLDYVDSTKREIKSLTLTDNTSNGELVWNDIVTRATIRESSPQLIDTWGLNIFIILHRKNSHYVYSLFSTFNGDLEELELISKANREYIGLLRFYDDDPYYNNFVFLFEEVDSNNNTIIKSVTVNPEQIDTSINLIIEPEIEHYNATGEFTRGMSNFISLDDPYYCRNLVLSKRVTGDWGWSCFSFFSNYEPQMLWESDFLPEVSFPRDLEWPSWITQTEENNFPRLSMKDYLMKMREFPNCPLLFYANDICYYIPMLIGLKYQSIGLYISSLEWFRFVYDYELPISDRKICPILKFEETITSDFQRDDNWLEDPFNPHALAVTRKNAYTRYTILSIVQCLNEYADSEYTRDTVESLPRALKLYEKAKELLNSPELAEDSNDCNNIMGMLEIEITDKISYPVHYRFKNMLAGIRGYDKRIEIINNLKSILKSNAPDSTKISNIYHTISENSLPPTIDLGQLIQLKLSYTEELQYNLITKSKLYSQINYYRDYSEINLKSSDYFPYFLETAVSGYCIPKNPVVDILRTKVKLSLAKIRACKNIAGVKRSIDPYAAPTDTSTGMPYLSGGQIVLPGITTVQPSQYRFTTLIEKAKQLQAYAERLENALINILEKKAQEQYNILKARQELDVAKAGVNLQKLRVDEASLNVELTNLQKKSSEIRYSHYDKLISTGWLENENNALNLLYSVATMQGTIATGYAAYATASFVLGYGKAGYDAVQQAASYTAAAMQTTSSILSTIASYERREQEWEFQRALASNDKAIGNVQVEIASLNKKIIQEDKRIAELNVQNAEDTVEFLNTKFGNLELYDWMGKVLRQIYSYFLQQATSMALTASNQLAFERQQTPPQVIKTDYWNIEENTTSTLDPETNEEKLGLLGAERLMEDITKLELYAFKTDERRLNLTRTISLASLSPWEFARFLETGVMNFATPMELFDREHPGHYMRLIHNVRVSVIALIPAITGIHATLTSDRISRVVIGGDIFQIVQIAHGPNQIAISSPIEASGIFELDPQSEILRPFEGIGVDTQWEFRMPKPSNPIDYRSIADVIITIEYTALNSYDFKQQVIESLSTGISGDRAFSFRQAFPDHWYHLNNSGQSETPFEVEFETLPEYFQGNLHDYNIEHITLYFAAKENESFEVELDHLLFTEKGAGGSVGGSATSIDRKISTRVGNGGSLIQILGKSPFGTWNMALINNTTTRNLFAENRIDDILFVITYKARTPEWPT